MTKGIVNERELLDRWRGIEEEDEDDHIDVSNVHRLTQLKELWFADAFSFLTSLPEENHIWCGSWDVMGPLLETFYNYFKDERHDSPLRILWKRISREMRQCIQCVSQHHQAQEMYSTEYDVSSIGPLLDVLKTLDEERVTQHLRDVNAKILRQEYAPARDNAEVVSVMYEVLMFPILMEDHSLFNEFETFIEAIDNVHELALGGHQQFPGVYALFFFKRRVRSVGHRLAGPMGKLRRATDLEPLQPLLKKVFGFLESEVLPSTLEASRPRVQLERVSVWIGIKSLLGYLEPPAFEEGILEHYPNFLDTVLNHISSDTLEFSHAVSCLGLLFEILGCKLWLRSTLSPSVMRNTLLGQCFHTRNEKIHKDIFDLFQPFLQSLEALQDGEHEKQRRHSLYFLLHQVPASSNFSVLIRKKACQIALLIIHRGYRMNPPCPPFECAHMWSPSLVSALKDSSLHSSLRQSAFDLIQTIIVSDAAALVTSLVHYHTLPSIDRGMIIELNDDNDADGLPFAQDVEEKDTSSWSEFSTLSKITAQEYREWICIPMLWIDVLVDIDPPTFPLSFSKAVFWARSRFSMVEPETSAQMMLPVTEWLSSSATEISSSFGWKVPTGSDDGGDGKESKNSLKVSTMCLPLVKTFNRLTSYFVVKMGQGELMKQWTWEPRMGESVILLLLDPNDNVRQIGKCILEQVSSTRGLVTGLKFLCSCGYSLSAIFLGFRHALELVQLDSVLLNFQNLQHLFFVLRKLLEECFSPTPASPQNSSDHINTPKFSSQGGFLRQPTVDSFPTRDNIQFSDVDLKLREQFSCLLSEIAWPSVRKCLLEGKAFLDFSFCQMTCVRILEILPVVLERLHPSFIKLCRDSGTLVGSLIDLKWLHDLIDWGKSPLKVIAVYWKRTVICLLNILKASWTETCAPTFKVIENLVSCDAIDVDELAENVSRLSVSLSKESSFNIGKTNWRSKDINSEKKYPGLGIQHVSEDRDIQIPCSAVETSNKDTNIIVLSDEETEPTVSHEEVTGSANELSGQMLDAKKLSPISGNRISEPISTEKHVTVFGTAKLSPVSGNRVSKPISTEKHVTVSDTAKLSPIFGNRVSKPIPTETRVTVSDTSKGLAEASQQRDVKHSRSIALKKPASDSSKGKSFFLSGSLLKSKGGNSKGVEINSKCGTTDPIPSKNKVNLRKSTNNQAGNKVMPESGHTILKELICDPENDPLELELKSARRPQLDVTKLSAPIPKRKVIQLKTPFDNKSGNMHRLEGRVKRFKLPSLDDWYRPILELDYLKMVGLESSGESKNQILSTLKEVPVCFHSPEDYVDIFRPLVLEEFKAQLHSSFLELSSLEEIYYGSLSLLSVERVDDFHLIRFVHDDNDLGASKCFIENDLVLLMKEPFSKPSHDVHMVGKVERRERDNKRRVSILVIRFYLQSGSSRLNQARKHLIERSKWHAGRIMSITSQLREFQALSAIKNIPLLPVILRPGDDCHDSREVGLGKLSQSLQQTLKSSFNESQLQAISTAIGSRSLKKEFELSLIQGPPGTGKTRTIVAIVSGLLASLQRAYPKNSPNDCSKQSNTCTNSRPQISQSTALARAWQDAAFARQLNEDAEKHSNPLESSARGRVLLCAQSNAAVDELVARISYEGLYGSTGVMYKPYLVRVGNAKTVHPNSLPYFIDTLVDHRVEEARVHLSHAKPELAVESSTTLRTSLEKLVDRIRFYEAKRASLRDGNSGLTNSFDDEMVKEDDGKEMSDAELEMRLRKLYEQKRQVYKDLSTAQMQEKKANEETKALRHKLRKSILREAEIVVTTLSGCGGDLYGVCSESMSSFKFGSPSEHTLFDAVVIDEAAQALEPATLIPLQLLKSSGTKCIMVGDPKQLPATVLSNVASKFMYQCSMFERLQRAGHPVVMLTKQYRMHPEICRFPSLHFYDGKLLNGGNMSSKSASFHETAGLGPYVFYDIVDGKELRGRNSGALSLYNEREADAAVELLRYFKKRHPSEFVGGRIGIITPYKSQLSLLRSRFSNAVGSSVAADMEFNTVDGFQGREVDILILSTVRAADPSAVSGINSSSIGFVADIRRMNVALTRAKLSLWILGNARTLQTNRNWSALVKDAKERNLVISAKLPYYSMFKSASEKMPTPKDSENLSGQLRHDSTVKDATQHSRKNERNGKETRQRKTKYIGTDGHNSIKAARGKTGVSSKEDEVLSYERSGSDEHGSLVKRNFPSVVVSDDHTMSKDHATDGESELKGAGYEKHNFASTRTGKRKVNYENSRRNSDQSRSEICKSKESKDFEASKGQKESHACNKSQMYPEASVSPTGDSFRDKDAENSGRAPKQASTQRDLISKRKQQREAVNAILPSALLPSKKTLPSKRSLPPTSIANGNRPSKTRRVSPASSRKRSERPDSSS